MREAVRSLLALILLGGFLELLLPQDEMRRYSRLVVGLLVLLSLLQLVLTAGRDFSLENAALRLHSGLPPSTLALLEEGEQVLRAGAGKAGMMLAPVIEERTISLLQAATGAGDLKMELKVMEGGNITGAKIILTEDSGVSPKVLQRLAGEILGINPETVEVVKVFARRDENPEI